MCQEQVYCRLSAVDRELLYHVPWQHTGVTAAPADSAKMNFYSPHTLPIQWNLSIEDTIGTQLTVLYREVSLIQR